MLNVRRGHSCGASGIIPVLPLRARGLLELGYRVLPDDEQGQDGAIFDAQGGSACGLSTSSEVSDAGIGNSVSSSSCIHLNCCSHHSCILDHLDLIPVCAVDVSTIVISRVQKMGANILHSRGGMEFHLFRVISVLHLQGLNASPTVRTRCEVDRGKFKESEFSVMDRVESGVSGTTRYYALHEMVHCYEGVV